MSPGIYMLTILVLPVTAIIVFAMKNASSYAAARARIREESGMRALMASHADRIAEIGVALKAVADEQSRQGRTLDGISSILREVG